MPPLRIEARGLHKRFTRRWIVQDFSHVFEPGSRTAIVGPNGSGKSTLVKLLCGQLIPSEGSVGFYESGKLLPAESVYRYTSLTGPYVELIEELTGEELLQLHFGLRGFRQNLSRVLLWERVAWTKGIRNQMVASYSSGMKQRLRLLLALATESSAVLLDEPTSNLDAEGVAWYRALLSDWIGERTLIVASNEERDFTEGSECIAAEAWLPKAKAVLPKG